MDKNERMLKVKKLQQLCEKLLVALREIFSEYEMEEVIELVEATEFGLAFDVVTGAVVEENKVPTPEVIFLVAEILILMECDEETYSKFSQFLHCYKK